MEFHKSGPSEKASETQRRFRPFQKVCATIALAGLAILGQPRLANAQETCDKIKYKISPTEFVKFDAETTKNGYRDDDNPEFLKATNDLSVCWGDCIKVPLPDGKSGLIAAIATSGGQSAVAGKMDGTEHLYVIIRNSETNELKQPATVQLAVTAQRYKEMTGHLPPAYRLVVEEGADPNVGKFIQVYAVPTEQKGAMPNFSTDGLPYALASYAGGKSFATNGLVCQPPTVAVVKK